MKVMRGEETAKQRQSKNPKGLLSFIVRGQRSQGGCDEGFSRVYYFQYSGFTLHKSAYSETSAVKKHFLTLCVPHEVPAGLQHHGQCLVYSDSITSACVAKHCESSSVLKDALLSLQRDNKIHSVF